MVKFTCPKCGQKLTMPEEVIGKLAKCPRCAEVSQIPCTQAQTSAMSSITQRPNGDHSDPNSSPDIASQKSKMSFVLCARCSRRIGGQEVGRRWENSVYCTACYQVVVTSSRRSARRFPKLIPSTWAIRRLVVALVIVLCCFLGYRLYRIRYPRIGWGQGLAVHGMTIRVSRASSLYAREFTRGTWGSRDVYKGFGVDLRITNCQWSGPELLARFDKGVVLDDLYGMLDRWELSSAEVLSTDPENKAVTVRLRFHAQATTRSPALHLPLDRFGSGGSASFSIPLDRITTTDLNAADSGLGSPATSLEPKHD